MEKLSMCVITTKFVVKYKSPIIRVIHDDEGYWQFLGKEENLKNEDSMIISLEEIIQIDNSLKTIIDLPRNKMAIREDRGLPWEIYNFEYDE